MVECLGLHPHRFRHTYAINALRGTPTVTKAAQNTPIAEDVVCLCFADRMSRGAMEEIVARVTLRELLTLGQENHRS